MENPLKKYARHLQTCNLMQDWTDAFTALSECPDGPDKDDAYSDMQARQETCTCGLEDLVKEPDPGKLKHGDWVMASEDPDFKDFWLGWYIGPAMPPVTSEGHFVLCRPRPNLRIFPTVSLHRYCKKTIIPQQP